MSEENLRQMEEEGMPDELLDQYREEQAPLQVWGQHANAVLLFLQVRNRWHYKAVPAGMGSLDIPAALNWDYIDRAMARTPKLRSLSEEEQDTLFEQLQTLEAFALEKLQADFHKSIKK